MCTQSDPYVYSLFASCLGVGKKKKKEKKEENKNITKKI
jgi:hypothetical protein